MSNKIEKDIIEEIVSMFADELFENILQSIDSCVDEVRTNKDIKLSAKINVLCEILSRASNIDNNIVEDVKKKNVEKYLILLKSAKNVLDDCVSQCINNIEKMIQDKEQHDLSNLSKEELIDIIRKNK